MSSYIIDKVPQQTKDSFETINSARRNDRGNHCTMVVRLDKTYYFATFMGQKEQFIPF